MCRPSMEIATVGCILGMRVRSNESECTTRSMLGMLSTRRRSSYSHIICRWVVYGSWLMVANDGCQGMCTLDRCRGVSTNTDAQARDPTIKQGSVWDSTHPKASAVVIRWALRNFGIGVWIESTHSSAADTIRTLVLGTWGSAGCTVLHRSLAMGVLQSNFNFVVPTHETKPSPMGSTLPFNCNASSLVIFISTIRTPFGVEFNRFKTESNDVVGGVIRTGNGLPRMPT